MPLKVNSGDNYNHLVLAQDSLDESQLDETKKEILSLMKKKSYLIIDGTAIEKLDKPHFDWFKSIKAFGEKLNATYLLAGFPEDYTETFEGFEIIAVPTVDEAVDFIYMEQVEKDLLGDDDFDDDEELY